MQSGIGEALQYGMLMMAIGLLVGSIILVGAAGFASLSQKSSKQGSVSTYLKSAGIALCCAFVIGAGPAILQALGVELMQYISPIEVFTG